VQEVNLASFLWFVAYTFMAFSYFLVIVIRFIEEKYCHLLITCVMTLCIGVIDR